MMRPLNEAIVALMVNAILEMSAVMFCVCWVGLALEVAVWTVGWDE